VLSNKQKMYFFTFAAIYAMHMTAVNHREQLTDEEAAAH